MTTYRKKPVEIDAVKVPLNEYADNPLRDWEETPEWLQEAYAAGSIVPRFAGEDYWYYDIHTLEGVVTASPDDYIIRGVEGELYPCKPSIFRATYEKPELIDSQMPDESDLDDIVAELTFAEHVHRANTGTPGKYGAAAEAITSLRQRLAATR